jgi:hypothetical protein
VLLLTISSDFVSNFLPNKIEEKPWTSDGTRANASAIQDNNTNDAVEVAIGHKLCSALHKNYAKQAVQQTADRNRSMNEWNALNGGSNKGERVKKKE